MAERVPLTILKNLLNREEYTRKVLPFIKAEYFEERTDKVVFEEIGSFITKYDSLPLKEVLFIELEKRTDITQDEFKLCEQLIAILDPSDVDFQWAIDTTEEWCKERAIYLALMESIKIADGQDKIEGIASLPFVSS